MLANALNIKSSKNTKKVLFFNSMMYASNTLVPGKHCFKAPRKQFHLSPFLVITLKLSFWGII